jgi:hypothetical protein
MGTQVLPNLAEQSMRPELRIVRAANSIVSLNVAEVWSDAPDQVYYEDKLGCARGIVFAFAFQAALLVVAAVCWKLLLH